MPRTNIFLHHFQVCWKSLLCSCFIYIFASSFLSQKSFTINSLVNYLDICAQVSRQLSLCLVLHMWYGCWGPCKDKHVPMHCAELPAEAVLKQAAFMQVQNCLWIGKQRTGKYLPGCLNTPWKEYIIFNKNTQYLAEIPGITMEWNNKQEVFL